MASTHEENKLMLIRNVILFLTLAAMAAALTGQQPATPAGAQEPASTTAAPAQASAPEPQAAGPATAADLLQPALSNARATLAALNLEKWKKGSVREEAEANVSALLKDLDNSIQPLITAADAAPGQLSKAIPLLKHLDAFYDVLLRVEEASRVVAPTEQVDALQQALLRVSQARIAYDDALETQAADAEKQFADMHTAVRTQQQSLQDAQHQVELAKTAAKNEACKPATPARKKRSTAAATKPAQSQSPAQKPQ